MILPSAPRSQRGAALIIGLIFLAVLTLVGVTAMRSTTLEYQISTNQAFKHQSFAYSETGRRVLGEVLDDHVFERGWTLPGGQSLVPTGLTVNDKDGDGTLDNLYLANGAGEDPLDASTLETDATFSAGDVSADLSVYRAGSVLTPGGASVMSAGYAGLGKSAAGGGAQVLLQLRSRGTGRGNARTDTGSDFRAVIQ